MTDVFYGPRLSSSHANDSLTNTRMPWLNRKLAILLLTLPFIPALSEKNSAYAKEEPSANNPGRVIRNPNERLELPTHRQMALEELLRTDPVFRREAIDIIHKGNEIEARVPFATGSASDHVTVSRDLFGDPAVDGDRGWYSYQNERFKSYVRARETQDTYKSHSLLPMVINGAIDFVPKHGSGILKDFVDKVFENALPNEIADARKTLKVDLAISEQAELILSEYDKGGWSAQLLEERKFFEGIGLDMRATPAQIEEQLPGVHQRIIVRQELISKREELDKLEERFKNLSEQYRRGNSSVRVQLEDVKSKLDKKIEETNKYTQEILISSIGELQSGISELLDWKRKLEDEKTETLRMQKAQDQINQFYAVVGALTDVCSLVSPEAAKIINGIGSVVGSIMSASLSGFAFGPVVGVVSSVIGFIGSLFSSPGPSLAEYVEKRFDRIESMLENMYKSLVERLNIIDQKVSLLMRFAEDNKDFQFEHRRRLAEIGFGVDRNSALLDQMALRLDQQVKTNFIEDVETSLRSYVDSVNSGSEVKPLKPDPEKWLKDFVDLGRQFSSEALFIGTYSPTNGDLDRSIRLRGLEFSEGLIFDAINRLLQSQHILGTDSPRNGLVISDAVISALKVQESWPQNYPRLSEEHARELKSYLDQRLAFYEKLTSKLVIEALATEYEKAVTAVILRLAELLKSEAFMQLCGIPSGIDLTRGLDQRIPPIFSPKGSVIPERKTGGFNVHFDHLRKFLTWQLRQELGGEIEFAPVPAELKPDIDLSPDLFNFNAEHILRTLMGYSVPVGDGKSEQTKPEASLALENHLTFLLSSPIVLTKEKQLVIPVFIKSVKVGGSAKEGNAEFEDIYHNAFYDHLELNSRITFKFLVSALKSTLDLNNLGVREISHIEFTPDKAYPIALWFKHASGPEASSVPGVEIKEDLYGSLCANWNERYNQMVGTSAEFSLRVLQHLVNRKVPMLLASESYKTVYEHLRANGVNITEAEWKRQNSIQIGKGTLGSNDITGVRLQVDHNGYHRILISIGGLGTYVIERSDAEILLKEMLASGDLVENYLNTNSYLPAALNREVDTFDLNLEVVGLNRQDDKTPAEKRYQLLERRSAAALLKYQEAFKALYDAMLILDDRSILMRSAIGLSVPDEILGSAELLYAVREDTGFLTSDYLLLKLAEISAGNLSFKDLFRILIDRKTEPTKNLKLGLDKLKPEEIQYGAARIRMAYVLLEEYLQQFNTEK